MAQFNPRTGLIKALILLSFCLVGCNTDLYTKKIAEEKLAHIGSHTLIENALELRYAENLAMAFSILSGVAEDRRKIVILTLNCLALLVMGVLIYGMRHKSYSVLIPIALVLAGGAGNVFERIFKGHVVDFIHVHYKNVWSFPIFNLADIFITVGGALMLLLYFRRHPGKPVVRVKP